MMHMLYMPHTPQPTTYLRCSSAAQQELEHIQHLATQAQLPQLLISLPQGQGQGQGKDGSIVMSLN